MRSFAHIVNPVRAQPGHELHQAQPLTFESMRRARERAQAAGLQVTLLACALPEDHRELPGFQATHALTRTVQALGRFEEPRPLPLLGDILERLYAESDAEVLVYTNVDLALHPDFYLALDAELEAGRQAFSINRRTVHDGAGRPLEWVLAQAGEPHGGHDCFVFERAVLQDIDFHGLCIGFPPIGRVMLAAMSTRGRGFATLDDRMLTFHVDNAKVWQSRRYQDYWLHNQREGLRAIDGLAARTPLSPLARALRDEIAAQEHM
jgi:hypothetical protein